MTEEQSAVAEKTDWREKSWENNVVINRMFSLDMIADHMPDGLVDYLLEEYPIKSLIENIYPEDQEALENFDDLDSWERREFLQTLLGDYGIQGFVAEVLTPVKKYKKDSDCASYSWGVCHVLHVHGETIEELYAHAFEEAERADKRDRKKGK